MKNFLAFLPQPSRWLLRVLAGLMVLLVGLPALAQYQIGEYRLARNESRASNYLQVSPSGRAGLRSIGFVGRVGGVSFEGVVDLKAHPVGTVDLRYDASRPDGSRAVLKVGSSTVALPLWDWQLRPIAEFADSKFTAAVSLFGEGPDRQRYFYIDYHPAFFDRLLGLRLLQADIMLIDPQRLRFPPRPDGDGATQALRAAGEPAFDDAKSLVAARAIRGVMLDQQVASWVLTDVDAGVEPTLLLNGGRISLLGQVNYYFWRSQERKPSAQQEQRMKALEAEFSDARARGNLMAAGKVAREARRMSEELTAVVRVDGPTDALRQRPDLLRDLNPQVYDAVLKTAQYSALFRGVKKHSPAVWQRFLSSVTVASVPVVKVPNEWEKRK